MDRIDGRGLCLIEANGALGIPLEHRGLGDIHGDRLGHGSCSGVHLNDARRDVDAQHQAVDSLVPRLGFRLLLFGYVGLLDGDDPRRLRRAAGGVGGERDQHAVARGEAAELHWLRLGQIGLARRDALQLRT